MEEQKRAQEKEDDVEIIKVNNGKANQTDRCIMAEPVKNTIENV